MVIGGTNNNKNIIISYFYWVAKFLFFTNNVTLLSLLRLNNHKVNKIIQNNLSFTGRIRHEIGTSQGIVGCTPTNVPLWETPI